MESRELEVFISTMYKLKGVDFSCYRQNFLLRRLNYRINATKSGSLLGYLNLLKKDNAEFSRFLDTLAINVSEFFRDPDVFEYFRENCLKEIISRKGSFNNRVIRIWSAGCAEGQEAYSLAVLFKEELGEKNSFSVRIWGTDIDNDTLEKAKKAVYDLKNLKNTDKFMIEKYFVPLPNGLFQLNEEIRQMVKFFQRDLINDPPLKYMDIIFCRNVMIYLSQQQQELLLFKFHNSLTSKGYLVIGKVESIWGNAKEMFTPVATHKKIFQKKRKET